MGQGCNSRTSRAGTMESSDSMFPLESEQTQEDTDGQGSLACCSPWGCKESDMTEQLNNSNLILYHHSPEVSGSPGMCLPIALPSPALVRAYYVVLAVVALAQSLSHVRLFVTPWTAACQASCPSPTPRAYSNSCALSR